ncbi:MAG TPA: BMP family ABC transporter substrate-binding protein [Candidatus Competibacteraceae bacterium]|nr:BMP family ABC transporter substrate-binding protein [Candidatus Competibacteraceae bacterium]
MLNNLKTTALLVTLAAGLSLAGPVAQAQEKLKVGFVYVSPIGDAGWTFQHERGRQQMLAALGERVAASIVENVPEGQGAERVIRELAASGHRLIFTTSFGYMNPTVKVAQQFPEVIFEHATGYKRSRNLGTYNARFYEGRYLAGLVAGKLSKSHTAGYVGAFPIPEVVMGINAFTLGMRAVDPQAQVKVIWVNAWFDPGKEREAAQTLLAQGADVLTHHTDSTAVVQAAEEQGRYAIAYHSDMQKYAPKAQLTAVTHNWGEFYTAIAQEVLEGRWTARDEWLGIKAGVIRLAPFSDAVPQAVRDLVQAKEAAIKDGTFHPFQGPVKDQEGRVRIAEGSTIADEELLKMDWYVEGVQGKLPK